LGLLDYSRDSKRYIQEWWIDTARWIIEHPHTLMQ
jgi:hypothetical protein